MTDLPDSLLIAYEKRDTATFAAVCAQLHESRDERQKTAERLLNVICEPDARRAELAINILRFTGMALEDEWCERLITAAEGIFSPEVLLRLAGDEAQRLQGKRLKERISPQLRLLRSVIQALVRKGGPRAMTFVNAIEAELVTTPLAARIAKWKHI